MRMPNAQRVPRTGFTLIELLVVVAIIAVLVGLTAAGVMKFRHKGPELQNRNDISQMSSAIALFKQKFNVDYVPSRIRLCRYAGTYASTPTPAAQGGTSLDVNSRSYMLKLFPRCDTQWSLAPASGGGIQWGPAVNDDAILYGEECLVFFLGGYQETNPPGVSGFSTNPANPMLTGGTRHGPFYDFKATRLIVGNGGFLRFRDVYNTPFAYFSSFKTRNSYNIYRDASGNPTADTQLGLAPYLEAAAPTNSPNKRYTNPESFQIISAGPDKRFGTGDGPLPAGGFGVDDLSNFYERALGAGAF